MKVPGWAIRGLLFAALLAAAAGLLLPRLDLRTDISFFLPDRVSGGAALLADRLRHGAESSLVMVGISGAEPDRLAEAATRLAAALRRSGQFESVSYGPAPAYESQGLRDVIDYRYLIGPPLPAEAFQPEALRRDLQKGLARLSTTEGWLLGASLPRDPTGRTLQVLQALRPEAEPPRHKGVWMRDDGRQALLVARPQAGAYDIAKLRAMKAALDAALAPLQEAGLRTVASGPGLFAESASRRIRSEMVALSVAAAALVVLLLTAAFRSAAALAVLLVPIGTAMLTGSVAVQAVFGSIHGVTLTFGTVLLGVAIDYPIHLISHLRAGDPPRRAARRIAGPLWLSALTTAAGFLILSQASFPGLAQLGLYATVGVLTAALVSRWLLPHLLPDSLARETGLRFWRAAFGRLPRLRPWRPLIVGASALGILATWLLSPPSWETDLADLGAVPAAQRQVDRELRAALYVPDSRHMLVFRDATAEAVLQRQERMRPELDRLVAEGALAGYEMAADLLPSQRAQRRRQAALPGAQELRRSVALASKDLPLREQALQPFLNELAAQRTAAPVQPAGLQEGPLRWRLAGLLNAERSGWSGIVPLRGELDLERLRAFAAAAGAGVTFLDMKAQADALAQRYLDEALTWLAWGALAALLLLSAGLRRPRRVLWTALPAALAVSLTVALLLLAQVPLTLFHVLALVLVASLGVDYALFLSGSPSEAEEGAIRLRAIVLCNTTTALVFAILALSELPLLHALGLTVATGAALCLLFTVALADPEREPL